MIIATTLLTTLISATSVTITQPVDGETYEGDWLMLKAIVENENEIPDSVHYELNGNGPVLVPRLNTDWPTYMQNYQNHGYSESPAPMDSTVLWTAPVTGDFHEFPTPVVVDGIVYYNEDGGGSGEYLYALDAATGEVLWQYNTGYADDAVTVSDGMVYDAADSIFCLDAYSGDKIWASGMAGAGGSTPIVESGKVYCGIFRIYESGYDDSSRVCCLDASDGSVVWADTIFGNQASCLGWSEGTLYLATLEGPLYAMDGATGSIIWENSDAVPGYWDSSPVVKDGYIYIGDNDGVMRAVDVNDGTTVWENSFSPGLYIAATPVLHGGRVYLADQSSSYHCINSLTGNDIWTVPGVQHGSSGMAQDVIFYGETGSSPDSTAGVFALDRENGSTIWSREIPCSIMGFQSSPSITDGVMYYACTDGNLYAFGTGLKYTYREEYFYADVGSNELIVTSYDGGTAVAADTINFTVTQQGVMVDPANRLDLSARPNPSSSISSISFTLAGSSMTSVIIYDLFGRVVSVLSDAEMSAGPHELIWDGKDDNGEPVSTGLYLCRVRTPDATETTGICMLR